MDLNVRIDKELSGIIPDAISFETGVSKEESENPEILAYEHHGPEFSAFSRGSLVAFYEDLILGKPMPLEFATPRIQDVDTLVAIALFLHRDLATHPSMPSFVYTTDFVHRMGLPALAHLDDHLARFFSALRAYFPEKGLSQRETSKRLQTAIGWLRTYVHEGDFSFVGSPPVVEVRVINHGSDGFVISEVYGPLLDGWVELYRRGYLRGLAFTPLVNDRRNIVIAKKSNYLALKLDTACQIFNQMETAMGELPDWKVSPDGLWLQGPQEGTSILVQDLTEVLVRV